MAQKKSIPRQFKDFVLRGDLVSLAVAVVMGLYFKAVVDALVKDIIMQVVAMIFGKPDFNSLSLVVNHAEIKYGDFLNVLLTYFFAALGVFFFVAKPYNYVMEKRKSQVDPDASDRPCPECLSSIPKAATRCAHCTAAVPAVA